jgi:hypothetical protein
LADEYEAALAYRANKLRSASERSTILTIASLNGHGMPKFYINFQNGDQLAKDDVGVELPSLERAWKAALVSAREIIADKMPTTHYGRSSSQTKTVKTF